MSSSVELVKAQPQDVARCYGDPVIGHFIELAVERARGKRVSSDLLSAMIGGRMQLWVLGAPREPLGIAITEVAEYPRRKVCRVIGCVGEGRERWQHHLAGIEDWARQIGRDAMELIARKGWARVVEGYDLTHVMLEKDL